MISGCYRFWRLTLVWHDFNNWQQIRALGDLPYREILVYLAAAIAIFGARRCGGC